jgi:murein DD-endopeptidase MepM/ murein hydrolase activator NlpD
MIIVMAEWGHGLMLTHRYKKLEKQLASSTSISVDKSFRTAGHFFAGLFEFFDRKLTVMVVPHSGDKVVNLQTNMFAMVLGFVLVIGVVSSFFVFNKKAWQDRELISSLQSDYRRTSASLDEMRDENNNLMQSAKRFQSALSKSLSLLGIASSGSSQQTPVKTSDLSSLITNEDLASGAIREAADIRQLTAYLEGAVQPIEQIGKLLESQGTLFSDIPSIWPIRGGIGHVSMSFGQGINPINGQWYIHRGLDLSTYRAGDPILVTANGQVVTIAWDGSGYGNYVVIKHKHGLYTLYGHMSRVNVTKGQFVSQGDIIGNIGATGVVTGPHLHYEVHVGSDVVDPIKYITMKTRN